MTSPINFGLQSVRLATGGERYISGKKWRLLRVLWMARGSIVRKQTILNIVWGERRPASENSIRELVRMLRRDLDGTSLKIVNYNLSGKPRSADGCYLLAPWSAKRRPFGAASFLRQLLIVF
jgi:hypothetical protein